MDHRSFYSNNFHFGGEEAGSGSKASGACRVFLFFVSSGSFFGLGMELAGQVVKSIGGSTWAGAPYFILKEIIKLIKPYPQ